MRTEFEKTLSKELREREAVHITNVRYGITEEIYYTENSSRISYGIAVYDNEEEDGTATVIEAVHDITSDRQSLSNLIDLCNRLELSTIHLYDVIEDFLSN